MPFGCASDEQFYNEIWEKYSNSWCKDIHDFIWLQITDYKFLPIHFDFIRDLYKLKILEVYRGLQKRHCEALCGLYRG